jgi:hypothetical protein
MRGGISGQLTHGWLEGIVGVDEGGAGGAEKAGVEAGRSGRQVQGRVAVGVATLWGLAGRLQELGPIGVEHELFRAGQYYPLDGSRPRCYSCNN